MDAKYREYLLYCGIKSLWHDKELDDFTNDPESLSIVKKYLDKYPDEKRMFSPLQPDLMNLSK